MRKRVASSIERKGKDTRIVRKTYGSVAKTTKIYNVGDQ